MRAAVHRYCSLASLALIAAASHHLAQSSALNDAGNWAAIAAAVFALAVLLWQIGQWAWGLYQASYISHGLHIASTPVEIDPDEAHDRLNFRIGVALTNTSGRPLSYHPDEFTLTFLDF